MKARNAVGFYKAKTEMNVFGFSFVRSLWKLRRLLGWAMETKSVCERDFIVCAPSVQVVGPLEPYRSLGPVFRD